jgi:hypothetical protein
MCGGKRAMRATAGGPAEEWAGGARTGETTRLGAVRGEGGHACGRFPWWTLWLIWPAIGLVKWTAPLLLGLYAELAALSVPLLPVLLILAGAALIARRRME